MSGQPCLLTSAEITKEGQQVYAYYALKIIAYNLSYDVKNTYSTASPYSGSINLSCNVVDNTRSGDLALDISALKVTSEIASVEPSGFSTTSMALANKDFSSHPKSVTFIIRYSYKGGKWTHTGMVAGGMEESVILDLETFPQNKSFREAVGMQG